MKKIIISLLILCLSGCTNKVTTETTTSESTTTETTTTITEATTVPETAITTQSVPDFSGFSVKDYCESGEALPAYLSLFSDFNLHNLDDEKLEIAVDALKNSFFYKALVTQGKRFFTYENGEYIIDEDDLSWWAMAYPDFFDYDKPGTFELKPKLVNTINTKLDGEHYEQLFVFRMPVDATSPADVAEEAGSIPIETSNYNTCCVTVYVNYKGEAEILFDCSLQTLSGISVIDWNDGTQRSKHFLFDYGHTSGTMGTNIVSFKNGECTLEYSGGAVSVASDRHFLLRDCGSFSRYCSLLFYDFEKGYCEVEGEPLSDEAKEILGKSEAVITAFPDFFEEDVYVYGGKYISVWDKGTFTFENGIFDLYECAITPPREKDELPSFCIKLE